MVVDIFMGLCGGLKGKGCGRFCFQIAFWCCSSLDPVGWVDTFSHIFSRQSRRSFFHTIHTELVVMQSALNNIPRSMSKMKIASFVLRCPVFPAPTNQFISCAKRIFHIEMVQGRTYLHWNGAAVSHGVDWCFLQLRIRRCSHVVGEDPHAWRSWGDFVQHQRNPLGSWKMDSRMASTKWLSSPVWSTMTYIHTYIYIYTYIHIYIHIYIYTVYMYLFKGLRLTAGQGPTWR